jgi:hypothetical protein
MEGFECSVWSNGTDGWGLNILGGSTVLNKYFRRSRSPVYVELDGSLFPFNIDKKSFWNRCPHLIGAALRDWFEEQGLNTGDRVWLGVVRPHSTFIALPARPKISPKEEAQ